MTSNPGLQAIRPRPAPPTGRGGFALVVVLILLTALYLGATGIFLAARAELRIGISHAASSQAFYLAESGLSTWLASDVQPSVAEYTIAGETVTVRSVMLLRVDSVTLLYRITAHATVGSGHESDPGMASRETSLLGTRIRSDPVRAITGSWREVL
ncbi:MAG: pilus assembly PilX N-terminal domain-containing protein [Gemmatimonadota bacterium]